MHRHPFTHEHPDTPTDRPRRPRRRPDGVGDPLDLALPHGLGGRPHGMRGPGGPWGPGGPLGPGGPGGPGGRFRGGPRARRGDVRSAILGLLADAPQNGYGLIRAIAERTDGAWTPSPGSVYPTLAQLVDEGLVTQEPGARGPYELTEAGREHVAAHGEAIQRALDGARGGRGGSRGDEELHAALRKLMLAAAPFDADVTDAQRTAALAAVDGARRELHRILAE